MKTRSLSFTLAVVALASVAAPLHAQLLVTGLNNPAVITFNETVGNVVRFGGENPAGRGSIHEPDAWDYRANGGYVALSSHAWYSHHASYAPTGFGADANGDGDTSDAFGVGYTGLTTLRGGSDSGSFAVLGANNWGLGLAAGNLATPWANGIITLRIQNTTGATVTDWSFFADVWYASQNGGSNPGILTFSWSTGDFTNNASFTNFASRTSTKTTDSSGDAVRTDASQWSDQLSLGDSFSATVLNGEYLYIQFNADRPNGGAGASWVLDNLTVTAVPEPSAFALLLGAGALGGVALRRRRR